MRKIYSLCKSGARAHQHGIFIGFCLILTAGIGYNIGRIPIFHANPTLDLDDQSTSIYSAQQATANQIKTAPPIKITQPNPKPADPRVVASKASSSKLYHHPWCSGAQRIKETNKRWFPTEADAISAGYTLAANCQ